MEQIVDKTKPYVINEKLLTGKWELSVDVKNSQGLKAFGGRYLTAYPHPLTGKTTYLLDNNDQPMVGYLAEKKSEILSPDDNFQHRKLLEWLLASPQVKIIGAKLDNGILAKKEKNATVTLRNLEKIMSDDIDAQDQLDKIIGRLSEDGGPKALSLKKLRYMLAYFNLSYFEKRYVESAATEKKYLRKRLKNFCKTKKEGVYMSVEVEKVIDEIEKYEIYYLVKEMMRTGVIILSNSMFKYNNIPVGTTQDSVIGFMLENVDIYAEAQKKTLALLKDEGFKVD